MSDILDKYIRATLEHPDRLMVCGAIAPIPYSGPPGKLAILPNNVPTDKGRYKGTS